MKVWQSKNIKVWQFNIELPYDPAILFLGIYQKKKTTQKQMQEASEGDAMHMH